jgi:hypothetical protein
MTNTMNKTNKYEYLFVLQGNYGQGWEDLCASESSTEVRQNRKEYRENEGGNYRIKTSVSYCLKTSTMKQLLIDILAAFFLFAFTPIALFILIG